MVQGESLPIEAAAALVPAVSIETLAEVLSGPSIFGCTVDPYLDTLYFRCPKCEHADHNRPSARVVDAFRWRCDRCRASGTRWLLERLVVEDAEALERLAGLLAAEESPRG